MIWALHGALGARSQWESVRGQGVALQGVALWDQVSPFREWARRFCDETGEADAAPSVLGYSMGGRLALHAVLERPRMWRSAIIVSAHPGLGTDAERLLRVRADREWARRIREEAPEEVLADWEAQSVLSGGAGSPEQGAMSRRRDEMADSMETWSLGLQDDLRTELGEISCPVLWVTGEEDAKFGALAREAAALMPRGEHVEVRGVGHRVPWQATEIFARLVIEFQNRVMGEAGA
jgi:2-succinyl-6-hydroxy-2,4-cyclohexadiene-1-carboxylate synthase